MKGKVYDTFIKVGKQTLITSHEIPILRTIRYIIKNLIQYLGISSSIA